VNLEITKKKLKKSVKDQKKNKLNLKIIFIFVSKANKVELDFWS